MIIRTSFFFLLCGCAIDYGVNKEERNEGGRDTAPVVDEPEPEDTAVPVDGPVADCQVSPNPVQPPFEEATWDGSASYSTDGEIVSYEWRLESKPTGSATTMPGGGNARRPGFVPDLAGDYVGRLTVTDSNGQTDSCTTTLEAIPIENLWIEMYWTVANDDMDLHLLRPGGTLESNGDCYFNNCVGRPLEWGDAGNPDDDPILDLDDIYGVGPENINITEPYSGTYTVVVHDYSGSTFPDYTDRNDVTVNIYINGALAWTDTKPITGNNKYVDFAEIEWPSGTVTGL